MFSTIRIAGALLAPLLLGACGLPIGIQIASLFADGVSYLATDKTLTDHGISVVTDRDCALWRGIEGGDICRAPADDKQGETIVAALAEPAPPAPPIETAAVSHGDADLPMELAPPRSEIPGAPQTVVALHAPLNKPRRESRHDSMVPTSPSVAAEPVDMDRLILGPATPAPKAAATAVRRVALPAAEPAPVLPTPVVAKAGDAELHVDQIQPGPLPAPTAPAILVAAKASASGATAPPRTAIAKSPKATYFIIASYHRAKDAARFSQRNGTWRAQVLEGTAKGRQVFRVAIGPVDKAAGRATKRRLKNAGFKDAWKLTLNTAPVATEVAALP